MQIAIEERRAVIQRQEANLAFGRLHYASLGDQGSPVVLVHGFPETGEAFEGLMSELAGSHRVYAVDLRGFGRSDPASAGDGSVEIADDLHAFIEGLGLGPVHLLAQDISGTAAFRLAASHPTDLLSLIVVESGLAGYGLEMLADVAKGGAWYIGLLATPRAAETFLKGREDVFIRTFIFPAATSKPDELPTSLLEGLAASYARPHGWSGAQALYASMLREGAEIRQLATDYPLQLPVLAIDRTGSDFTLQSFANVHAGTVRHATIDDVGHYIAIEAPGRLASAMLPFLAEVDAAD